MNTGTNNTVQNAPCISESYLLLPTDNCPNNDSFESNQGICSTGTMQQA